MSKSVRSIAVVDDDESFARAIGRLLRASGFAVHTYASAEAFLAGPPHPPPDCLLLDVQLGGMSGPDLLDRLRELGNLTPAIFVTGHDAPQAAEQAKRAGCAAYLRKPVSEKVLLAAIAEAIRPDH